MSIKEISERSEVNQHFAALLSNVGAIRAVTEAVEGTLGPKGLDCMLIDEYGDVLVTNDGVTILRTMDVTHPAARMLIGATEHQESEVGDGTTTTAVLAGSLVQEGANQILKGVPVNKVIEGIRHGVSRSLDLLADLRIEVTDLKSSFLENIATVSGRGNNVLAQLIMKAACFVGEQKIQEPGFKLAEQVFAFEGSENLIIQGAIIDREPMNREMPREISAGRIIILDDALEPERIEPEALGTEYGFQRLLHNEQLLRENLQKLAAIGVKAIFTDRAIADLAEEILTDLGILGVQSVSRAQWQRLAGLTGARPIKKISLAKQPDDLLKLSGTVAQIVVEERLRQIRVYGEPNRQFVTILIGAQTTEVVRERERIAKDTAAAVQAAWLGGIVPGGGSAEMAISRQLITEARQGMADYGFQCVIETLKRPMAQICINAGLNPLEKLAAVMTAMEQQTSPALGVDCNTGMVVNLAEQGIYDPYFVKYYALQSAGEIAEAILRINTIIKMKEVRATTD